MTTVRRSQLALVVGVLVLAGCASRDTASSRCAGFESARWKAWTSAQSPPGTESIRRDMAEVLVACHTLDGKNKAEISTLLGTPEQPGRSDEPGPCYEIGVARAPGALDNEHLCLSYGRDGRVAAVTILTL